MTLPGARARATVGVAIAFAALVAAGCSTAPPLGTKGPPHGGTLRVVVPPQPGAPPSYIPPDKTTLDWLQQNSYTDAAELLRCCLGRTLLSYVGRPTNLGGAELRPDLATSFDVSSDGLTWTFHIRSGLHYAPPMQHTDITAGDFVRALQRAARVGPGVPYYSAIVGFDDYAGGKAQSIAGLETPDMHTLVVHLSVAQGDFGYRMSLAYVVPLPPSPADPSAPYGIATGHDDGDGFFIVSSGPYMLAGSDKLDFSAAPAKQTGAAGVVPGNSVTLVRNPSWRAADDPLRPAYVDRIVITYGMTLRQAATAVMDGHEDITLVVAPPPQVPPDIIRWYQANPSRGRVVIEPRDSIRYISMNLATPPFDDIHVRRAVAFALDRTAIEDAFGGAVDGTVIGHLAPDSLEDNALINYDPYRSANEQTRLLKARQEMAQSRYDSKHAGSCDAAVCQHVVAPALTTPQTPAAMADVVRTELAQIGIHLDITLKRGPAFFNQVGTPMTDPAMALFWGWIQDYPSGSDYFVLLYSAQNIQSPVGFNPSLLGATPSELHDWGYTVTSVPSVQDRMDECLPLVGSRQTACWTAFDEYMMEKIVPAVPFVSESYIEIVPPRLVAYSYDQFVGVPALDQIALAR